MPLAYDTLLDLAQQRLAFIAASPNWTRAARHDALKMQRDVADELAFFNCGSPRRALIQAHFERPRKEAA